MYIKVEKIHTIIGDSMDSFIDVLVRSLVSIVVLFLITELMGKKQLNQLNMFDYVIGITIGSLSASLSIDESIDYVYGVFSIIIYGVVSALISYLTTKSIKLRRFLTGTPLVIINDGKINYNNLKKSKLDINDLLQVARENGYYDLKEINYVILEPSGKVSFLPKAKYLPATRNDLKLKVSENSLCANLIIDGNIMEQNLKQIKKDKDWLITRLNNMGYKNIQNILLVTCDNKEKLTVYLKENQDNIQVFV